MASDSRPRQELSSKKPRILVADADRDYLSTMEALLSIEGCEVRTASEGAAVLGLAAKWQPDVILMDVNLPVMDGCEVAKRIREAGSSTTYRPLIVAVTGWQSELVRDKARTAGVDVFLLKPVPWEQLSPVIRKAGGVG